MTDRDPRQVLAQVVAAGAKLPEADLVLVALSTLSQQELIPPAPWAGFSVEHPRGRSIARGYARPDGELLLAAHHPAGLGAFLRDELGAGSSALAIARRIAWVYATDGAGKLWEMRGGGWLIDPERPRGGALAPLVAARGGMAPTLSRRGDEVELIFWIAYGGPTGVQLLYRDTVTVDGAGGARVVVERLQPDGELAPVPLASAAG